MAERPTIRQIIHTADGITAVPFRHVCHDELVQLVAWVLRRTGYARQHNPSNPGLYASNLAQSLVEEWEAPDEDFG